MSYSVAAMLRAVVSLNPEHPPVNLPLSGNCSVSTEQTAFQGQPWASEKGLAQKFEEVLGTCRLESGVIWAAHSEVLWKPVK